MISTWVSASPRATPPSARSATRSLGLWRDRTVTNLASRLCGEARAGQILVSKRVFAAVDGLAQAEPIGELSVRGFLKAVPTFNVTALKV